MSVVDLSEEARAVIERERDSTSARAADLRRQSEALHAIVERVDADLENTERLLRRMDEVLGRGPQLPLDALDDELRGQRLREVAVELLRQRRGVGVVVHYTEWFALLEREGVRVGGKRPMATFLTQIGKASEVESVRPRSGLYRLKAA